MTNVESMDYTHSHPSIIASLFGTMHCPFSHWELVQTSPVHPNPVIWYALSHINLLILPQNSHHTYLLWHFHSHSEIYCHATFHRSFWYDTLHHCHIALHDHVVDMLFVAKPPFMILTYMSLLIHCTSRYTVGVIHIESYLVLSIEL